MPPSYSTRIMPLSTIVYSSKSGRCPGSLQPAGLIMCATLTCVVALLTTPTYSSICLFPGTGMIVGAPISVGMVLVIAVRNQIGYRGQCPLIGRLRKLHDNRTCLFGELLRLFPGALDAPPPLDEPQNVGERNVVVGAFSQHGGNHAPLLRGSFRQCIDQRQGHFALSKVAANRFSQHLLPRR